MREGASRQTHKPPAGEPQNGPQPPPPAPAPDDPEPQPALLGKEAAGTLCPLLSAQRGLPSCPLGVPKVPSGGHVFSTLALILGLVFHCRHSAPRAQGSSPAPVSCGSWSSEPGTVHSPERRPSCLTDGWAGEWTTGRKRGGLGEWLGR